MRYIVRVEYGDLETLHAAVLQAEARTQVDPSEETLRTHIAMTEFFHSFQQEKNGYFVSESELYPIARTLQVLEKGRVSGFGHLQRLILEQLSEQDWHVLVRLAGATVPS